MDWRRLPKIEFHRHLDGSLRQKTIVELAEEQNIDLGFDLKDQASLDKKTKILKPMDSLQEVLDTFWTTQKVMNSRESLYRVAYENVEDVFHDGVVLSELRFAPSFIRVGKPHLSDDDVILGVLEGIEAASTRFDIEVGLIHIIPRSLDPRENARSTEAIFRFRREHPLGRKYLVGIDLADAEVTTNPTDFVSWIDRARNEGMHVTIHSAEDSTAIHACKAIELYRPRRIGHGIKIALDEKIMQQVAKQNIHLENCPTSNFLTRSVSGHDQHPFKYFLDHGVSVSLNSDDPHLMGIDLTHEYELAYRLWGMSMDEMFALNAANLQHSFLSTEQIEKTRNRFFNWP